MTRGFLIAFSLLVLVARAAHAAEPAEPIVEAERAFAKSAVENGFNAAFREVIAPDGVVFAPDPVPGPEQLAKGKNRKGPPFLRWWPVYAGIARSGDLGFTTEPFIFGDEEFFGFYFSIWRKQPDGAWKVLLDHGADLTAKSPLTPETKVAYMPLAEGADIAPAKAVAAVRALEAAIAQKAQSNIVEAYAPHLASFARIVGSGAEPVHGVEAAKAELARRSAAIDFAPLGEGASLAGDLVYTYGDAKWIQENAERRGHYVRIWQQHGSTWKIVFDELVPRRG
jgi:ketosteroid isomerase-like protein